MAAGPYERLGVDGLSAELRQHYNMQLLMRAMPLLTHIQFGRQDGIPRNEGKSIDWRRFERPAPTTTALTEGTPGAVTRVTVSNVQATVDQFGAYWHLTDVLQLQAIDPQVSNWVDVAGEMMGISLDTVVREVVHTGSNVQFASTAASRGGVGSGMVINFAEIREAVANLRSRDAVPVQDGKYIGIIHPNTEFDLFGDSDILESVQRAGVRGSGNEIFQGQLADFYGVRWITTSRGKVFSSLGLSGANVYSTLVLGREFYGVVDYDAMGQEVIVKPLGSAGTQDPLNQVSSIGWKAAIAAAILNDDFGVRIEHMATLDTGL
jgi:N4-gp56 family major capsid protein